MTISRLEQQFFAILREIAGSESCLRLKLLIGELLISDRANQDLVRLPRRLRLARARSRPV